MKLLSKSQTQFLYQKKIKVGGFYIFPTFGFNLYAEPNYDSGIDVHTNPFTKSLANEFFIVKEIHGDFCKGNFQHRPKGRDFYMTTKELSKRGLEKYLLFILLIIPFLIYNLFKGKLSLKDDERTDNIVLLGKKGFGYYFQIIFFTPLWLFSLSPTKKSWKEFKYGLISHKCAYDYDKPIVEKSGKYEHVHFNCKHYGCNIVSMTDEDGNFDFDKEFNKKIKSKDMAMDSVGASGTSGIGLTGY